ncbi:nitrous oxide reductase family maturation protein NosD [Bosea sp. (in: a-proteobacteria)]|uniref:right-handed parallel beta-helix repeat-containing protein n=1 Tax=Bosea sp. (in: a-proteobacteria) TaxID=1871050 RepID=UPI002607D136|nr:right-handed parallel beta-helix repeat-containing protein [Bosea sp. (in: a-proteobacteria)]MCO5090967.1 right-handed parallel beta-helix repeat-containing protein [Bosea sp. (in: a-proteobacteria)]
MANFYVSTTGNDANSGLDPSSAFATLERAQAAMRQSGGADTTYLAGGTYHVDSPIRLTSADSGSSFVASPGQNAIVSGGSPVTGWTQGANGVWSAHVDDAQVLQLTVGGVQQVQSRFPDVDPSDPIRGGWLWGQDLPRGADPGKSLAFDPADFPAGHAPQVGQTVTVFSENGYANDRLTIASVNGNVMTFTSEANYDLGPASRFYVSEPVPDGVGEWSFDSRTGTILFKAPAGFTGEGAVASSDHSLFVVDGAKDVTIRGLTLTDTAAVSGDPATGAIEAHNATGLTVDANHFANVGLGVALHGSSTGNVISGNSFEHIWSSAIALTAGTSRNTISNNTVDHSNEAFVQYGAIDMQESARNQIDHNTITNVPRFAISENNHDPNIASGGNVIEYNDIRHAGQQTPDVGAIYLFSHEDPGAMGDTIRYNSIVDAGGLNTRDGGFAENWSSGIYLDNLASNAEIYGNYIEGTSFSGILIHGGSNNSIHDNTVLDNGKYGISTIAVDGYAITGNKTYENFIQVSKDGSNTIDTDQTDPALIHGNVYYNPDGARLTVADVSLASFQQRGGDVGSVVTAQSGFANAANGDYSFTAGSAAQSHGIESVPFGSIGATGVSRIPDADTPATKPPATAETTPPVTVEPAPPALEPAPPVVAEPAPPVVAEPAPPVVAEPAPPVVAEPAPPVVAEPAPPVVAEPAPPVVAEPSPPVVAEPSPPPTAAPGGWGGWGGHHASWTGHGNGRNWFQDFQAQHDNHDHGHFAHWHW